MESRLALAISSRQSWSCREAVCSTQRSMLTISPVSCASPMNFDGGTSPSRGCCQRASASTARTLPVITSTIGM